MTKLQLKQNYFSIFLGTILIKYSKIKQCDEQKVATRAHKTWNLCNLPFQEKNEFGKKGKVYVAPLTQEVKKFISVA